jgi:hypothetical protein
MLEALQDAPKGTHVHVDGSVARSVDTALRLESFDRLARD